jgi:hypothetical protein
MAIQKRGTGFTNLSRYLEASKGAKVGQALQGGLERDIGAFKQGLTGAQKQFGEEVGTGTLGKEEDVAARQAVLGRLGTLSSREQVAGTGEDQTPDIITQQDIEKFGTYRGGKYTGPQELKDTSRLLAQSQGLEQLGKQAKSEGGRLGLLQQYIGGTQPYSRGQQRLDALLLGAGDNTLGRIARTTQGLARETGRGVEGARGQAQLATAKSRAFGEETGKQLTTQEQAQRQAIQSLVDQYKGEQASRYQQALGGLQSRQVGDIGELQGLKGTATYGIDPTEARFLSQAPEAQFGTVMTPEQQARFEALTRLSGGLTSNIPQLGEGRYDPTQAIQFELPQYQQASQQAQQQYEGQLANLKQQAALQQQYIDKAKADTSRLTNIQPYKDKLTEINNQIATLNQQVGFSGDVYTPENLQSLQSQIDQQMKIAGSFTGMSNPEQAKQQYIKENVQPLLDKYKQLQEQYYNSFSRFK